MLRPQVGLFRWKAPDTWRSYREVTFSVAYETYLIAKLGDVFAKLDKDIRKQQ
ncbi:hypothetical protein B7P43_G08176 [Cryptotermes secundus]|uniref:Uncharacterized protein n=1 Tax=Cryptotermes secundus TaxID=105785 RepID=A0A2J7RI65_9NEOP|nr:hypothetical protein B7P43_G08176 [Cryptotermes secundus]